MFSAARYCVIQLHVHVVVHRLEPRRCTFLQLERVDLSVLHSSVSSAILHDVSGSPSRNIGQIQQEQRGGIPKALRCAACTCTREHCLSCLMVCVGSRSFPPCAVIASSSRSIASLPLAALPAVVCSLLTHTPGIPPHP